MNPTQSYLQLVSSVRECSLLDSIGGLMGWDEQTCLPTAGVDHRANQQSLLARIGHERFTSPRIGELLGEVEQSDFVKDPISDAAANVRETRRLYDRASKVPAALVEELSRTGVLAHSAWAEAKKKSHFPTFEPWLDKMLDLKRQEAECFGYASGNPYDALLDGYEPGETAANVQKVFDSFRAQLVDLVGRIVASGKTAPLHVMERKFPVALQEQFAREAAKAVGFDFSAGRMDVAMHPFCSGMGPGDTRITTRFDENFFGDAFFSVLHEVGHGLYEQGLPKRDHYGLPVAEAISLGIHESQSRMWENLVGRSRPFWKHFFPKLRATFGQVVADVSEDDWLFAINDVRPSLIRTEADETTYNLHVMLRFELEQAMLRGQIKAHDVPAEWNKRMQSYLGLTPPDDARGCLQDVHWSHGLLGYFPTYTLGNIYAAQLFQQANKDEPGIGSQIEQGRFESLLGWLRDRVHRHGKRHGASELIRQITGQPLNPEPMMQHLNSIARDFYQV